MKTIWLAIIVVCLVGCAPPSSPHQPEGVKDRGNRHSENLTVVSKKSLDENMLYPSTLYIVHDTNLNVDFAIVETYSGDHPQIIQISRETNDGRTNNK